MLMTRASIEKIFEGFCFLSNLIALLRFLQVQLYVVYPIFSVFLFLHLFIDSSAFFFGVQSVPYFYTFIVVEPLLNVAYLLMVWELFSVIFRDYAGLRSLSRWVMGGAAALGAGFSLVMLGVVATQPHLKTWVPRLAVFERTVTSALVVFIIILLFFISRYPIKLSRNSIVQSLLCSLWFLIDATYCLLWAVLPSRYSLQLDNIQIAAQGLMFLSWATLLSQAGQQQPGRVRRNISPEREKALIGELDALNDSLMRAGRSISHSSAASD